MSGTATPPFGLTTPQFGHGAPFHRFRPFQPLPEAFDAGVALAAQLKGGVREVRDRRETRRNALHDVEWRAAGIILRSDFTECDAAFGRCVKLEDMAVRRAQQGAKSKLFWRFS